MSQKFDLKLIELLKKDIRFVNEEDFSIIQNEIVNAALKGDDELISLLVEDKEIKNTFFKNINNHFVFNTKKFIDYIYNKYILSNSYTKYKNQIGLTIDEKFFNERGEVSLVWPFKDCVLEAGMTKEDQKRNEIFFNEILAKDEIDRLFDEKVITNIKKITTRGEEKLANFTKNDKGLIQENLLIKGNNLLVLHTLKNQFAGKIKLIFIDPPYNTPGDTNTFTYNNTFNHSSWLTFMRNRLDIAKELISEDGFIAITIDHNELLYLGVLTDEIFGRENRIGIITIVHKAEGRNQAKFFGTSNEFMLVYAKNKENAKFRNVALDEKLSKSFTEEDEKGKYKLNLFIRSGGGDPDLRINKPNSFYPIYVSNDLTDITLEKKEGYHEILPIKKSGQERTWKTIKETFLEKLKDGEIIAKKDEMGVIQIYEKYRINQVIKTHWIDPRYHAIHHGTNLLEKLLGEKVFSYPKSLYAVLDTLKLMTSKKDIVLDFFAGSGTTGHATLELNREDGGKRQFILVEQLDEHITVCKNRLVNVLKEYSKQKTLDDYELEYSFVYFELKKYNEEAIQRIQDTKTTNELYDIWEEMCENYFLNYDVSIKKFNENRKEFERLPLLEQKKLLIELLNKNQLYVNLSEINDLQFKISESEKELNKKFYGEN
ncbi:MAG: site-specific DNA-methyltransferase [Candidatus Heimdallarchaeota archaeon]|nr:site-specific DNA-methyltransferase [Candidatus Heimdallarchaeota archaeon]